LLFCLPVNLARLLDRRPEGIFVAPFDPSGQPQDIYLGTVIAADTGGMTVPSRDDAARAKSKKFTIPDHAAQHADQALQPRI
jgi:hypothetical protein